MSSLVAAVASLLALPALSPAGADWVDNAAVQERLGAGEVVVQSAAATLAAHPSGRVRAAIRIQAPPEAVWAVITDCRQTLAFVPGLKRCRSVRRAPDGSWEDIEHELRYAWFLPSVRYVFRATYQRPARIDFRRVSGDLKEEEGSWRLSRSADGSATVVAYEMYLEPGFWVPRSLVTRSLRQDLPAALSGLRERVESRAASLGREPPPSL